jgi:hypothetical protein
LAPDGKTTAGATIDIAGQAPLDYWLALIATCPRLQPVTQTVHIAVHRAHLDLYTAWAKKRGFPESNIISDGARAVIQLDPPSPSRVAPLRVLHAMPRKVPKHTFGPQAAGAECSLAR